jgi:alpha-ketoglutarate-dependent 2,4-dichlorophenoxyacetate dioxygenase
MKTTPLHPRFGVIVEGIDLDTITEQDFAKVRQAFEEHSALLFRNQTLSDEGHIRLAEMFGPLENREAMAAGRPVDFEIPKVSNETSDGVEEADSLKVLDLQSNMLWHTDSTFLPIPALVNILVARVLPSSGGATELASTRTGWADMPDDLRAALKDAIIWHRLSHSRSKLSAELAATPKMTRWPDRPWRAIWPNPVTGEEALYIASHAFTIEGMGQADAQAVLDAATEVCTRPDNVYSHQWQPGDVLIWDERAVLHRGTPWPYHEPRTLSSICCSVTEADGLEAVRIV